MRRTSIFLNALLCITLSFFASDAARASTLKPITEVEGIVEYRLPNGLQVLLFPDASKPTTTVNITYRVGSRHENYGETGMAHLLEHLLFKGTPTHPFLWKEMANRGFNNNGTTWLDRTNYYESFVASDDNLKWALEMEADRMVNSKIDADDLKTEMTVVRNEYEMGENNPFGVLLKRSGSVAYDWHSYGKSTIGNRSDIENVGIENLRAFYRLHYQPDNATLLIGGKFDPKKALEWVERTFGAIPKPTRVLPSLWTTEPVQDGERTFAVRRAGDVQILLASYKVPAGVHADTPALTVLTHTLGDDASGRLKKVLVDAQLASEAFSFATPTFDPGLLHAGAVLSAKQSMSAASEAMLKVLDAVGDITPAEVTRAQNAILTGIDETLRAPDRLSIALSEAIAQGDWRLFFYQRDLIKKVTAADVSRVAAMYLKRDNRTLGMFIPTANPERVALGVRPDIAAMLKDYKGDPNVKAGEAFDPTPANLLARTQRFTLANGLEVALMPKQNRGEGVVVALRLNSGSLDTLKGTASASALAGDMLMRGTTTMSRAQIKDKFDALKTSAGVSTSGASLTTTRPHLEEALKLTAHVLRNPNFPADEFEKLKQETLTNLDFSKREPQTLAFDKLAETFRRVAADDPRYTPTREETIAQVTRATRDATITFYNQFVSTANGQLSIVGDFDPVQIRALVTELFGAWRAPAPFARIPLLANVARPGDVSINTPDKENAFVVATHPLNALDTDADFAALTLANYILGGNPGARLFARVREKEGLSYDVGSRAQVPTFERGGSFMMYAIAAPANVEKAVAAMKDETAAILRTGFTAEEVTKAKNALLQERRAGRAQDSNVANAWTSLMFATRDFAFSQNTDDKLAALTADDVTAALRKHIVPAQLFFVRALDQAKAAK